MASAGVDWWPRDEAELVSLQHRLGVLAVGAPRWVVPAGPLRIAAVFAATPRDHYGPGSAGDRAIVAAVSFENDRRVEAAVIEDQFDAPYAPGLLARREGRVLERAVRTLQRTPDVLMVNATGRDHPRRAGLALHLGAACDVPSLGVTDRPLLARTEGDELRLDDEVVAYLVRPRSDARPVVVHAGWRIDAATARAVVLGLPGDSRTPTPLREARRLARTRRAELAD